jgi:CRP-like cAMP-binding protein
MLRLSFEIGATGVVPSWPKGRKPLTDNSFGLTLIIMLLLKWAGSLMQERMNSRNIKSKRTSTKKSAFDAQAFLDSAGLARRVVEYRKSEKVYSQGESTKDVLYIQKGGVKLSVVNEVGKEAVVAMLRPGDFFGEGGWRVSFFVWGRRPRSLPRPYSLLKRKR